MRNRVLSNPEDKYKENAWDNVQMSEDARRKAEEKIKNDEAHIPEKQEEISYTPWDLFYKNHQKSFFKERQWILKEFPELNTENKRILEVGCGTGSTLAQIPQPNEVFGIDCSESAIRIIEQREEFKKNSFFCTHNAGSPVPLPYTHMDYVLLVFTLSAIHPSEHITVLSKISNSLKKEGMLLFRDYGSMDLTHLRFKPQQILQKNLYRRGEGTYAYFFEKEEITELFKRCKLEIVEYIEDRRLLINRKKQLEMPRHWIQIRARKSE